MTIESIDMMHPIEQAQVGIIGREHMNVGRLEAGVIFKLVGEGLNDEIRVSKETIDLSEIASLSLDSGFGLRPAIEHCSIALSLPSVRVCGSSFSDWLEEMPAFTLFLYRDAQGLTHVRTSKQVIDLVQLLEDELDDVQIEEVIERLSSEVRLPEITVVSRANAFLTA